MAVVKSTLGNIFKVTKEQYNTLINGGTITDGTNTYTYDANAIYLIDDGINRDKIYLVDLWPSSSSYGIIINFGDKNDEDANGLSYAYIGEKDDDALLYHADSHTFEGGVTFKNGIDVKNNLWLSNNSIYHKSFNQDIYNSMPASSGVLALKSEIPTKLSQLNNDVGYITGIGSTDVINALGYTPGTSNFSGNYNDLTNKPVNVSTFVNDAGYITSASFDNYQPLDALLTSISALSTSGTGLLRFESGEAYFDTSSYCTEVYVEAFARQSLAIIATPLMNINTKSLTNYTSDEITVGGYTVTQILTSNSEVLTEQQASTYMAAQCGSGYVPKYNYDNPKNTFFITADFDVLKPQYDTTNGLLLYKMGKIVSDTYLKSNFSAAQTVNLTWDVYTGSWSGNHNTYSFTKRYIGNGMYLYTYINSSTSGNVGDIRYSYNSSVMKILAYGGGNTLTSSSIPVTTATAVANFTLTDGYLYVHYAHDFWFIATA